MFDFMKRKKKGESEYPQDLDTGCTVPLVPGYDDPLAGSTEIPVPEWTDGNDSNAWYGPPGGGYGIPTDMSAYTPEMVRQLEPPDSTIAEPVPRPIPADSTVVEEVKSWQPQPPEDIGCTVPLESYGQENAGIPAYPGDSQNPPVSDNPTVGLPPHIVGHDPFVRVDSYTGPSLVGEKGVLAGKKFSFKASVTTLGVDYSCDIVLPLGTPGISRRHLRFWLDGQTPCAMDLKSTYGSMLNDEKMKPGLVYNLNPGDRLKLGGDEEFRID